MIQQTLTPEQAFQKIKYYCAYQERCHAEVKEKLYGYGLIKKEVEGILSSLIEEDYLNEERFAVQFTGGKFRMKKWGRLKIKAELKSRQVSEYCIKKALASIDEDDYLATIKKIIEQKKRDAAKYKHPYQKTSYLLRALQQKGYEPDMVKPLILSILNK